MNVVSKEYLTNQFKNYDRLVAEEKYGVTVDSALSGSSENPVQNKVVKAALDGKQATLTAGTNISINNNTVSATIPTASTSTLGGVKIDGTTITINNGVISSSGSGSSGTNIEFETTDLDFSSLNVDASGDVLNVSALEETVLWTNTGSTNPGTITLDDNYTNYKLLLVVADVSGQICTCLVPVDIISDISNVAIGAYGDASYIWYTINTATGLTKKSEGGGLIVRQILGYK